MQTQELNNRELKDLLNDCQSVERVKIVHGHKLYIWKKRAVLDKSGKPIPLDEFMANEVVMQEPAYDMSKGPDAIKRIAEAKNSYKASMRALLGDNWKNLSRKFKIYNAPTNDDTRRQLLKSIGMV